MTPSTSPSDRKLIAPLWHTFALTAILLSIAAYGAYLQIKARPGPQLVAVHRGALTIYLSLIAAEWGLLRFVSAGGIKRYGVRLRDLIGGKWSRWQDVARDAAIAAGVWAVWVGAEALASGGLGPDPAKGITTLLPQGPLEMTVWSALSLTAGFCEEVVFRGYLQKQIRALTGNVAVAVATQAVIFGVSHGYQGLRAAITIALLGALYGALAEWRKSLRPGMVLHAWMDIFGGILSSRA